MKCHAGVEFPSDKPCPKCGAKLGEVCWPGINADLLELKQLRERYKIAVAVLEQCQDCIRGETPEDMTDEEAREDTISKIREIILA